MTAVPVPVLEPKPASSARLPVRLKVIHGMGSIAYGVKDSGFSTFLLLFYNQVIGLDAAIVGAAIMIALVADAFVDPLIGELSDRTRSQWGRRLPWLYGAPIPLAFAWLLLWNPPAMSDALTIAWLIGFAIVVRTLVSMCEVPSVALVPELTRDYDERTIVMRYRFLFAWAGGLAIMFMAYGVFFSEHGETDPAGYFGYSLTGACIMVAAVILSAAGQHRRIAKPAPLQRHSGLGAMPRDMLRTLANNAFLWLVAAGLFAFINQGISFALTNYLIGFFWQLTQVEKMAYVITLFASMIAAFVVVALLSARLGKRDGAILAGLVSLGINGSLYLACIVGVFPGWGDKPDAGLMFAIVFLANTAAISMMILLSSMMADVIEASQSETGRRSEGLFFAGYFFMQKMATGIGIFIAGQILTFADFPRDAAQPGQIDSAVLDNLAIGYLTAMLTIGLTSLAIMRRFPISRSDHRERVQRLSVPVGSPARSPLADRHIVGDHSNIVDGDRNRS